MVLPEDVKVYCAHEYTLSNAKFATHIDPENKALQQKTAEVEEARSKVCLWFLVVSFKCHVIHKLTRNNDSCAEYSDDS
jgi:glyoxylase-like metal-dependent hydrolase (beta-lactamase superfamily II)